MPTSYTALIESGDVKTGKDFIRACLPQFGFKYVDVSNQKYQLCEEYNDYIGDIPHELEETRAEVKAFESMPIEQFLEEERKRWFERRRHFYELTERYTKLNKLYDMVYQEVLDWDAPDDLKHIKAFALDQIRKSVYDGELEILFKYMKDDPEPTMENIRYIYEEILDADKRKIARLENEIGKYWDSQEQRTNTLRRIEHAIETGFESSTKEAESNGAVKWEKQFDET